MARQGVIIDRSTLAFWMGYAAAEVAPVVTRLREIMLASTRIFADETMMTMLDPGRGKTRQGYFWVIARDDRAWGGSEPPAVIYQYAPGRGIPMRMLCSAATTGSTMRRLRGLQAIRRPGSSDPSVTLAFCWSHVRRGFYDLAKTKSPIAIETLRRIAALYHIEAESAAKTRADRLAVRQARAGRW